MSASDTLSMPQLLLSTPMPIPADFVYVSPPMWAFVVAYLFSVVELIVHPLVLLAAALNTWLLCRPESRFLHPNLRFILIFQSITIGAYELTRFSIVLSKFLPPDENIFYSGPVPLQWLINFTLALSAHIGNFLCGERIYATFRAKVYERRRKPYLAAFMIINAIVVSAIAASTSASQSWGHSTFGLIMSIMLIVVGAKQILVFWGIEKYNGKKYRNKVATINDNTLDQNNYLSEKYQLSENIRTSRQLLPSILFHFIASAIYNSLTIIANFRLIPIVYVMSLTFLFASLLFALLDFLVEITVITHHPILKKRAMAILHRCFCLFRRSTVRAAEYYGPDSLQHEAGGLDHLKNMFGETLIDRHSDAEEHFATLKRFWEASKIVEEENEKERKKSRDETKS